MQLQPPRDVCTSTCTNASSAGTGASAAIPKQTVEQLAGFRILTAHGCEFEVAICHHVDHDPVPKGSSQKLHDNSWGDAPRDARLVHRHAAPGPLDALLGRAHSILVDYIADQIRAIRADVVAREAAESKRLRKKSVKQKF